MKKVFSLILFLILISNVYLKADFLYGWGNNDYGQLGINKNWFPRQIGQDTNWLQVACGYEFTVAIKSNGTLWAWGRNEQGQLGDGTIINRSVPVQIGNENNWLSITCGDYRSIAIKKDGTLWAWGSNVSGGLGDSTTINRILPVQIGTSSNWLKVVCGTNFTLAIMKDSTLWAWGNNYCGQIGDGSTIDRNFPVQISKDKNWSQITCGDMYALAIKNDGTLWAWGYNLYGQLGDGSETGKTKPIQIGTEKNWFQIVGSGSKTIALKKDGSLWEWGIIGIPYDTINYKSTIPVQVENDNDWLYAASSIIYPANNQGSHTVAIKTDGTLWAWGLNYLGQLGDGTIINRRYPVPISSGINWSKVACGSLHTVAIKSDGTIWAWGSNSYGQLGIEDKSKPNKFSIDSNWVQVSCGRGHFVALKDDGTLWATGNNEFGQLGDGTRISRNQLQQIGTDNKWIQVQCGTWHTVALKKDGSIWSWGLDNISSSTSPIQIASNNNWQSFACGHSYTLAIKKDGTLWGWGNDYYGQLGDSIGRTIRKSPVQIGNEKNWLQVTCSEWKSYGLKKDGTLWHWGLYIDLQHSEYKGPEGFYPVQLTSFYSGSNISLNYDHLAAIKSEGSLWTLSSPPYNSSAQLDQIGTETNWQKVSCGIKFTTIIKKDGTLWSYGLNDQGQLGDGTITDRIVPVQIGTNNNWSQVSCGGDFTMALAKTSITSVPELSTENNSGISLNIKPNPANEVIEIDFTSPDLNKSEICFYSIDGKLVDKITKLTGNSIIYNTSKFTPGEYSVVITSGNEKAMQKLVIVR